MAPVGYLIVHVSGMQHLRFYNLLLVKESLRNVNNSINILTRITFASRFFSVILRCMVYVVKGRGLPFVRQQYG